jgi:hypothetical protein
MVSGNLSPHASLTHMRRGNLRGSYRERESGDLEGWRLNELDHVAVGVPN